MMPFGRYGPEMVFFSGSGVAGPRESSARFPPRFWPVSGGLSLTLSMPFHSCLLILPLIFPAGEMRDPWFPKTVPPVVTAETVGEFNFPDDHLAGDPLGQLERLQAAWNSCHWEDALKRYLELPEKLRTASSFWVELDGIEPGAETFSVIRDRLWRHLQDRLTVLDSPGQGKRLHEFLPSLDRLYLICTVTGMPLPDRYREVRRDWQCRVQCRLLTDEWLFALETAFELQDDSRAGELLRTKSGLPWLEESTESRVNHLLETVGHDLHDSISEAMEEGSVSRVLDACQRLGHLGIESPESDQAHEWALKKLRTMARHNLDMDRRGHALLQLARLAVEEESQAVNLGGLREQLMQPLRPRILNPGTRPHAICGSEHLLLPGTPLLSEARAERPDSSPVELEPVGRFWSRSPGHLADAKRWVDLIDSIVQLNRRWLESHPSEAAIIRERIDFHVTEAHRLGERLEVSPARRSRIVWREQSEDPNHQPVRVTLTCPIHLFTENGREVTTAIEISEILQPTVSEGIQLPVSRFEIERVQRRLLARVPEEIGALADRWAADRLDRTLSEARGLARNGSPRAALELLLPALLGASGPENSLLESASSDLAEWSGLGRRAVEMALGKSETP